MRDYDEYRQILELWELGIPKKRIAIILTIPRATVRDCITRYRSVEGLQENKERALRSTPDEVLSRICNAADQLAQQNYSYILGLYLGDGNITKVRNVYRLRITLDARYSNIIKSCSDAVQVLLPDNQVGYVNRHYQDHLSFVDVSSFYKFWPDLLPQHGTGKKHNREIKLTDWQQQIIEVYPLEFFRGLYHSDGSRFSNIVYGKDYPRYQFTNHSDDIRFLFCQTCDRLGLHWTSKSRYGRTTDIFISRRKDVEFLDSVICPKT
jgi:hypothetical protein